mmetsp:Transcript_126044/g.368310  ORF Transcript_126044/g.368310 Transcript_126044/m.368310 type:complete len:334 (+) Transcript_126044:128-1129(+)
MRGGEGGSLWDSELVANVAFHPRKCQPSPKKGPDGSGWIDSDLAMRDGTRIAYRLYTAPRSQSVPRPVVLLYFHANAELCTDLEPDVGALFDCGFHAVLCPEYRGFAWSGGKPRLTAICGDAEAVLEALASILEDAGFQAGASPVLVLHGRSLGSACAVHLAARHDERVAALVVESGVMSLLELPMVRQLGAMMPEMLQLLRMQPCPLSTLNEMRQAKVPTLIIHGDRDEISPVEQAVAAHRACGAGAKKLLRYPYCHHNDVRAVERRAYYAELRTLCQIAAGVEPPEVLLQVEQREAGFLGFVSGVLKCFPGMRRCLAAGDDVVDDREHPHA